MLGTDREPGIYVRTLNDLFRAIEETSSDMEYEVSMSYLEVSAPPSPAWTRGPEGRASPPLWGQATGPFPGALVTAAVPNTLLSHLQKPKAQRRLATRPMSHSKWGSKDLNSGPRGFQATPSSLSQTPKQPCRWAQA